MGRLQELLGRDDDSDEERAPEESVAPDAAAQRGHSLAEITQSFAGADGAQAEGLVQGGQAGAAQADKPAYSPERLKRLLRGQYKGLLKLYQRGELDESAVVQKMMVYDYRIHGGALSAEGAAMIPQLIEAMKSMPRGEERGAPAPAPVEHAPPAADRPAKSAAPKGHAVPHVALDGDQEALISDLEKAGASDLAQQLRALGELSHDLRQRKRLEYHEEVGENRDVLVSKIGLARAAVNALAVPGAEGLKKRAHHRLHELAPYYSQGHNVDIIENIRKKGPKEKAETGTCSITSLAMALESLGVGTTDYKHPKRLAKIYDYFMHEHEYAEAGYGTGGNKLLHDADDSVGGEVTGLRLPDFLELAAIAENCGDDSTPEAIRSARYVTRGAGNAAWITSFSNQRLLASRFGVAGKLHNLSFDLKGWAKREKRAEVDKYVHARAAGKDVTQSATVASMLAGEGAPVETEAYRDEVLAKVGPHLDDGKAVMMNLTHHYVRVQSLHEDHVIVDDPGHHATGSGLVVPWNEAMAMGYFAKWLVLG